MSLAAIRAIEDNQAPVLSLSFGACEAVLGNAGNQFWSGLWEQAASKLRQDSRSLSNPRDGGTLDKSQYSSLSALAGLVSSLASIRLSLRFMNGAHTDSAFRPAVINVP